MDEGDGERILRGKREKTSATTYNLHRTERWLREKINSIYTYKTL